MTVWQRMFVSTNPLQVERAFIEAVAACDRVNANARRLGRQPPATASRRVILKLRSDWHRDMDVLAERNAVNATAQIRERLKATRSKTRGPTGVPPHLRALIFSRPLRPARGRGTYGTVGVARESTLDRAVNPNTPGYGSYWRAQEFGTGNEGVPKQAGRVIRGFFFAAGAKGAGERPNAAYRGGGGPHPIFIPGRPSNLPARVRGGIGARGGQGGYGTIGKEITPGHFIRDGADQAAATWRAQMHALDVRLSHSLARAVTPVSPGRARTFGRRGRR